MLQPEMKVEDVEELLEKNEKGIVKNCVTNAVTVFTYDPLLRGNIRYNELTQMIDITKNLGWDQSNGEKTLTERLIRNTVRRRKADDLS